jgi:hypothetical protein
MTNHFVCLLYTIITVFVFPQYRILKIFTIIAHTHILYTINYSKIDPSSLLITMPKVFNIHNYVHVLSWSIIIALICVIHSIMLLYQLHLI